MGYQSSAETVIGDLAEAGISSDGLSYLLPTHVHLDHSGSCGNLAKEFRNASVLVHPKGQPHLEDPSRLWAGATELFGAELVARYGKPEPIDQKRLRIARNEEVIDLGGGVALRIVWTPGHASHHLSYELEGRSAFVTGDSVGICFPEYPVLFPTTPPTSFNLEQALRSLERIRTSSPTELYTPHYGLVRETNWIVRNVKLLSEWGKTIELLSKSGLSPDQVSNVMIQKVCSQLGRDSTGVPDYLRISARISTLGFLRYLARLNPST